MVDKSYVKTTLVRKKCAKNKKVYEGFTTILCKFENCGMHILARSRWQLSHIVIQVLYELFYSYSLYSI